MYNFLRKRWGGDRGETPHGTISELSWPADQCHHAWRCKTPTETSWKSVSCFLNHLQTFWFPRFPSTILSSPVHCLVFPVYSDFYQAQLSQTFIWSRSHSSCALSICLAPQVTSVRTCSSLVLMFKDYTWGHRGMESKPRANSGWDVQVPDLGEDGREAGGSGSIRPAEEQGGAGGLEGRGTWVRLGTHKSRKDGPHRRQHGHWQG